MMYVTNGKWEFYLPKDRKKGKLKQKQKDHDYAMR